MQANSFLFSTVIASFLFFSCDKEEAVKETALPAAAKTYITTHFPNTGITSVIKDKEINKTTYDVVLQDGTSLDFTKDGDCTEVDGHNKKIPDTVVPAKILQYVQTTYPTDYIVSWEKDGAEQDVDLGSNVELKFDKDSNFLRVDD
ncbi:PepSY-like domain-containing protein [Adhaeribacter swui]|uniref:PepSY-like domain-containing protein n=1 Tax=Adhaeribacter swui TaxID=2086471 RepID=A0A7G7GE05_9BACT|nr:PepSY-like domain-containing protein [Adhaeribacter swui]QNF35389.1 PepSY-like domain-containing protein [Adhaeribacter swui]